MLRRKKENKKSKRLTKKEKRIKRTVQNAIQYKAMLKEGICYLGDDLYSSSMMFTDVNYQIAREDVQESIWQKYMEILNSLGSESGIQLIIHNHSVDEQEFENQIMMQSKHDGYDKDRNAFNEILKANLNKGTNNIVTDKIFVYTTKVDNLEQARKDLSYLDREFQDNFKELGCETHIMSGEERLEQMYTMFHPKDKFFFDYQNISEIYTTKDAIAPSSFDFSKKDSFRVNDKYCRVLFLKDYSTEMTDTFINDLIKIEKNLTISFHMKIVERGKEVPLIKTNIASMEMQKMDEQRKALRDGYDPEMIPMELKYSLNSAYELLDDVQKMNQRLFVCQFYIYLNCDSEQELEETTKLIYTKAKSHTVEMIALNYQQEKCMNACLPLGKTDVYAGIGGEGRTLTTPVVGIMIPFTSQELMQKSNSIYYGLNTTTNNLIYADRRKLPYGGGFYLAKPGSGKSFACKREIVQLYLNTNDDIIVIDPESEYENLARRYNGTVVKVDSTNEIYLNPLEGELRDSNFLSEKADFMQTIMAQILEYQQLDPKQKSVIDRTLRTMYNQYEIQSQDKSRALRLNMPTLDDFVALLEQSKEEIAQDMALALGIYTRDGTYNMFSKPSNIDPNNRLAIYDIKELSAGLKPLGMLVILESIWERIKKNAVKGVRTWIYIDEFDLLFDNDYCVEFFYRTWKRSRKFGAIMTGITQNVEILLQSVKIRTMLSNSNFIVMLDQSTSDRDELAELLNLSPQMLSSITNAKKGSGLLLYGSAIIPFRDDFPKDNPIYPVLTSDFDEKKELKSQLTKVVNLPPHM